VWLPELGLGSFALSLEAFSANNFEGMKFGLGHVSMGERLGSSPP